MNPNAKFQPQNLRTRIAEFFRTALAVIMVAMTLSAPVLAAQVSAPTGVTLPRGLPILVQWTPSDWPSSTVDITVNQVVMGGWYPAGPVTANVNNNGQTYINLPHSLACNPASIYMISVEGFVTSTTTRYGNSANFKLSCEGGSITVVKTAINDSGAPILNGTFQVDVTCGHNGPNTTLALSNVNSFQDSVMYIPLGRNCTINEQMPHAPTGCRWLTTYPQGKTVVIGNADYRREIHNQLSCLGHPLTDVIALGGGVAVLEKKQGSLTVIKKVVNDSTTIPPPNIPFQVQVICSTGGPYIPITLTALNGFTQVVGNIPASSSCTIAEQAPVVSAELARRGCGWTTSYPDGQAATMTNPASALNRTVVNHWNCKEGIATGTLTVTKTVTDLLANEPAPNPSGGFQVTVTCNNGITQIMHLNRGGSQMMSGLPVGATCTVTEAAASPPVLISSPRSCRSVEPDPKGVYSDGGLSQFRGPALWNAAAYSPGQTLTIAAGANAVRITNSFRCALGTIGNSVGSGKR